MEPQSPLAPTARPDPAGIDLQSNTMQTVLLAVAEGAVGSTPAATAASITLMKGDRPSTFVSTGALATALDETQYDQGYGPCLDAVLSGDVMEILDTRTETRWPRFTPVAADNGALSTLSLPIPVLDRLVAGLNVYATEVDAFGPAGRRALLELVGFGAAAIANMHLYEESQTLVEQMHAAAESRAVIDQAKGVLMSEHRCTAEEAFAVLRTTSQRSNRKIRDLATEIVERAQAE